MSPPEVSSLVAKYSLSNNVERARSAKLSGCLQSLIGAIPSNCVRLTEINELYLGSRFTDGLGSKTSQYELDSRRHEIATLDDVQLLVLVYKTLVPSRMPIARSVVKAKDFQLYAAYLG